MSPRERSHKGQKSGLPFSRFKNRREVRETKCMQELWRFQRASKFYHQSQQLQCGRCLEQRPSLNVLQTSTGKNLHDRFQLNWFVIETHIPTIVLCSKFNYYYPFLDHVIQHTNDRFPEAFQGAFQGTLLIASNPKKLSTSVEEAIERKFAEDLYLCPSHFSTRLTLSLFFFGKPLKKGFPPSISAFSKFSAPTIAFLAFWLAKKLDYNN